LIHREGTIYILEGAGAWLTMSFGGLHRIECSIGMVAPRTNTCGGMRMEISVIEQILMHAAQRGVLDEDAVIAAVDRMWSARATFQEAVKIPQTTPQEKESKMAQALEEFNEASKDVVALLNTAARGG
jgi:hypothetical protein